MCRGRAGARCRRAEAPSASADGARRGRAPLPDGGCAREGRRRAPLPRPPQGPVPRRHREARVPVVSRDLKGRSAAPAPALDDAWLERNGPTARSRASSWARSMRHDPRSQGLQSLRRPRHLPDRARRGRRATRSVEPTSSSSSQAIAVGTGHARVVARDGRGGHPRELPTAGPGCRTSDWSAPRCSISRSATLGLDGGITVTASHNPRSTPASRSSAAEPFPSAAIGPSRHPRPRH